MKIESIKNWHEAPIGGAEVYNPDFKNKSESEIIKTLNVETDWLPFGYNHFMICKPTSTVYIKKIKY